MMFSRKKILIIGTESRLAPFFSDECDIEVISSPAFIPAMLYGFVPDLIVVDSVYDIDIRIIRVNEKLVFTPILILADDMHLLANLERISDFPRIMLCATTFLKEDKVRKRVWQILEDKKKFLPPRTGAIVKKIIVYISMNFSKNLTRESLSQVAGTSEDYLSKIFRAEMGLLLWDYLTLTRLHEAEHLLSQTGLSVSEVAARTGFEDPAYFNRIFKKHFGQPPGQFRKGD